MNKAFLELAVSNIEIIFATEGCGKLFYGDKTIRLEHGDLFLLPIGEDIEVSRGAEASPSLRFAYRKFHANQLGMAAPILPMKWKVFSRHVEEFERLLCGLPERGHPDSESNGISAGWEGFMNWMLMEPEKSELRPFEAEDSPIRQALSIMSCRFMNSLSVPEISRRVAMSTRHFQRVFKSFTGRSFVQLLQEIRIRHSCGLLQYTRLSVQAVAETVGISDMYSFYRLFRNHCGMTPAAFRLRNQAL